MTKRNSSNQDFSVNADGFDLTGGTTGRKLTITGADITLTGSGTNVYTFPAATDTLMGRASTDIMTNKTFDTAGTGNSFKINGTAVTAVTGTGSNVLATSPALTTPNLGTPSAITLTNATFPNGSLVQVVDSLSAAVNTGTIVIPIDDTIPQNTEGDQYMSLAITPKSTTNTLVIQIVAMLANTATTPYIAGALFQDATAGALAAAVQQTTASSPAMLSLTYVMAAGTTSATTFKFRAGGGGTGTTTFNGQVGGRFFGTANKSSMVIWEYKS